MPSPEKTLYRANMKGILSTVSTESTKKEKKSKKEKNLLLLLSL